MSDVLNPPPASFAQILAAAGASGPFFRQLVDAEKDQVLEPLQPIDLQLGYELAHTGGASPPVDGTDPNGRLTMAIPRGYRCLLWTPAGTNHVYLIETGKHGALVSVWRSTIVASSTVSEYILVGHLVSTQMQSQPPTLQCGGAGQRIAFVVDDIFREGRVDFPAAKCSMQSKCGPLFRGVLAARNRLAAASIPVAVAAFFVGAYDASPPPYPVRHYQTRSIHTVAPRINCLQTNTPPPSSIEPQPVLSDIVRRIFGPFEPDTDRPRPMFMRLHKPTYHDGRRRVFLVQAHPMGDIYHLYCRGADNQPTDPLLPDWMPPVRFYSAALVPDAWTSAVMKVLFREPVVDPATRAPTRGRQSRYPRVELDRIEESDDDEPLPRRQSTFDLDSRRLLMECEFDWPRKMWIPRTLVGFDRMNQLVPAAHL